MRAVGWFGVFHVLFLIGWMVFHIFYSWQNPLEIVGEKQSLAETGIQYWAEHQGILGFDHGSKALLFAASILLMLFIYMLLNPQLKQSHLLSICTIGLCCKGAFQKACTY